MPSASGSALMNPHSRFVVVTMRGRIGGCQLSVFTAHCYCPCDSIPTPTRLVFLVGPTSVSMYQTARASLIVRVVTYALRNEAASDIFGYLSDVYSFAVLDESNNSPVPRIIFSSSSRICIWSLNRTVSGNHEKRT